ncbi:penicillin-binding protein 2 [Candidatus Daviesbacteria bacterium]|nr:penicillin-binding protein 2 [Candidatus Daviesbacteria bacterium]
MVKKKKNLGYAFGEELSKVKDKIKHIKKEQALEWTDILLPNFHPGSSHSIQHSSWVVAFFAVSTLVLFFVLFLRLFHLQIVTGKQNRELADGNRIQIKIIHAPRGVIFDRNGKVLAANSPAFRLVDREAKTRLITREEALELEVKNDQRVADLEVDNLRNYPKGQEFAHILGYVGQISQAQLNLTEFNNYKPADQVGKMGVEAQYESLLRGIDGGEIIEVDSKGNKLRTLRRNPPIAGQNIYLTIDADLQTRIYQLMQETLKQAIGSCCGAAIAMDPTNGQVLALVSLPSFDPNIFTQNIDEGAISDILTRSDSPILNRVIAGTYPPGSTFKIISSLAALSSGKISPETTFVDNGFIYLGTFKFSNWYFNQYGKVEGSVNLTKAIQRSNDTYFYEVARIIGEKLLGSWAKKVKMGGKLNIDLPGEAGGIIPDGGWKKKNLGEYWYPGDTLHMVIGQGFVTATPLQILGITSFIAADGNLYQPQILLNSKPKILISNLLTQDKIKVIKEGLKLVPKTGGTAWPFFTFPIITAGKTGTAEYGDVKNRTHAWYTSFAPADDPKIAMTVLIEGGGEGSSVAAPVVKETYRWYFSTDKNKLIEDIYTPATDSGKTLGE